MERRLTITADDYGLTRHNTDDILETVDRGAVTQASLIANGEAVAYAIGEYAKRRDHMALSVHLNLTEGPALSPRGSLPLITDEHGHFKYSPASLLLRYALAGRAKRSALRAEITREIALQWRTVSELLKEHGLAPERADGHQHVHVLPFVFRTVLALPGIRSVRIPTEPFYIASTHELPSLYHLAGALVVAAFARCARAIARAKGIETEDAFIGLRYSGTMTLSAIEQGLAAAGRAHTAELALHPGSARADELATWKGSRADIAWHLSPWREKEKALVLSQPFRLFVEDFVWGRLGHTLIVRIFRFCVSGTLAAVINLGVLYLLTSVGGVAYTISLVPAFIAAVGVSFTLQKFWTFENARLEHTHRQVVAFVMTQLVNLCIDEAGVILFVSLGLWYLAAQVIMLVIISLSSYLIFDRLIFPRV